MWCRYWSPVYWWYCDYDPYYWDSYWRSDWDNSLLEFHDNYDFDEHYPSIYTPPALMIDPTSRAIEYLDEGAALFREGRYLEAFRKFRMAKLVDLTFGVSRFAYAHGLFALGIYDYAAFEIREGLRLLPEWVALGGDLKLMYGEEQDFVEQWDALVVHLKVLPRDEDALLVLGYVAFFSGDLYLADKAFEKLSTSVDLDTASAASLFTEAIAAIKEKLFEKDQDDDRLQTDDLSIETVIEQL